MNKEKGSYVPHAVFHKHRAWTLQTTITRESSPGPAHSRITLQVGSGQLFKRNRSFKTMMDDSLRDSGRSSLRPGPCESALLRLNSG